MPTHDWQKSSYCQEGDACVHVAATALKSSYCQEGEACVHVAATPAKTIHLTESSDPTHSILSTTPTTFSALLRTLKGQQN
ncbi:DUF397 domain-containing protein [Streptomyces sp. HC44]|uniref:DUF397 domain-containing protein n=1 Tax=Streptomyces scabichelini TaxID=2711217 RepID=A0A6G4VIR6_9ACTN|nr:DUF397 domain-containing protein [Streptomyces scabichelini]NGO13986.1 DUF397 domain-containing protein [Streptomyces scabichelini]